MIEELHLEPHPEGGYYRRTFTSPIPVQTPGGTRPAATLIHFFLPAGEASAWHRVASDEVWLWHGPGRLTLQIDDRVVTLGAPGTGVLQQALVPAGAWQRTLPGEQDVLVSCLVSPGFDFEDFELAGRDLGNPTSA